MGDVYYYAMEVARSRSMASALSRCRPTTATHVATGTYGPSLAAAVVDYKTGRKAINKSYPTKPDNMVGKTIKALDDETVARENELAVKPDDQCPFIYPPAPASPPWPRRTGLPGSSS